MIGISLKQLEVFVAIASAGTVRAAAERLFVTQPAVSMALSELERQLDAQLFDRERGRLRLSQRGKEVLPMAQEVIERTYEILRQTGQQPLVLTGELHVGASNTIGNYLVGELLGGFIAMHPQVSLQVSVENTETITANLLEHRIDVGCVEGPVNHPQLEVMPWRDDALVVCAAPAHPLALQSELKPRHFKQAKWILRERGSAMRVQAEQALNSLPAGQILLELGQVEAIKQAVIAGLGLALLPRHAVQTELAAGLLRQLEVAELPLRRSWCLVSSHGKRLSPVAQAFQRFVRERRAQIQQALALRFEPAG